MDLSKEFEATKDLSAEFEALKDASADKQQMPPTEAPTQLEAGLRGLGQGIFLGYSEEALAALEAAKGRLTGEGQDLGELYRKYRDIERSKEKAAKEAFPKTYGASQIGGAVGTALIPGLGAAKLLSPSTLKGAAALGAVAGIGESEADLTKGELGGLAGSAALGAGTGAIGFKVGQAVSKYFAPAELEKKAASNIADILEAKGLPSKREQIGEAILKSNVLKQENPELILKGVKEAKDITYKQLTEKLTELEQQAANTDLSSLKTTAESGAKELRNVLLARTKDYSPENKAFILDNILPVISHYEAEFKAAGNNPTFLQELKQALTNQANDYYKELSRLQAQGSVTSSDFGAKKIESLQQTFADLGKVAKDQIEAIAEKVGEANKTSILNDITSLNKTYGGLVDGERLLTKKLTKEASEAKAPTSELGALMGILKPGVALAKKAVSTATEQAYEPAKLALAGAEKGTAEFLKKYSVAGKTAELAEKGIQKVGARMTPENLAAVGRSLMSQPNTELTATVEKMKKYPELEKSAEKIQEAIDEKDNTAKNARLMAIMQDPKKRLIVKKLLKESGNDLDLDLL